MATGLRHIVKPQAEVSLADGQSFTVSALSPNHIFGLYHRHRGELGSLYDAITGGAKDAETIAAFSVHLFNNAPMLLAEIVALAAGANPFDESPIDPENPEGVNAWQAEVAAAAGLPFPAQVDALNKIGELTFTSEMPPKKFLGVLLEMMRGARTVVMEPASEISTEA